VKTADDYYAKRYNDRTRFQHYSIERRVIWLDTLSERQTVSAFTDGVQHTKGSPPETQ